MATIKDGQQKNSPIEPVAIGRMVVVAPMKDLEDLALEGVFAAAIADYCRRRDEEALLLPQHPPGIAQRLSIQTDSDELARSDFPARRSRSR